MRRCKIYQPNHVCEWHLYSGTVLYKQQTTSQVVLNTLMVWVRLLCFVSHVKVVIEEESCESYSLALYKGLVSLNFWDTKFVI